MGGGGDSLTVTGEDVEGAKFRIPIPGLFERKSVYDAFIFNVFCFLQPSNEF